MDLNVKDGWVEIFDVQGQLKIRNQISESRKIRVDIGSTKNGLYFFQIKDRAGKLLNRGKVVVSKK